MEEFDCIVIGGGQGASLATRLARGGCQTALIEKAHLGGTCINYGCTPTKTLIASARVAHSARCAERWGVRAGEVSIDMEAVVARKDAIVREFRGDADEGAVVPRLHLICGEARFSGPRTVQVLEGSETRILRGESIVIATGTENALPPVDGLDAVDWLDAAGLMSLREVPDHLLIVGGGYIAVEMAQAFRRFGARVTIVERNPVLLEKEDKEVSAAVRSILEEEGVQVLVGAQIENVEQQETRITLQVLADDERRMLGGSHLLVAAGRKPATDALNLEAAGIECNDKGFVQVDEFLSTDAEGVFALGDVAGSPPFTHMAFDDARILADRLLHGKKRSTNDRIPTWTVFLDPQLGRVGLSEAEAHEAGKQFEVARIAMADVACPIESGEERGFWKVLVEKGSGKILGGTFLSMGGGEVAGLCLIAMAGGLTYDKLRDLPIAHPTLAESFNNLFLKFDRERAAST